MAFIHPKSDVDPKAKLGKNVYVAAFACIRADEGMVSIGDNTSVQETCVVHGKGVSIGKNVTMGHGAIAHGCKVRNNVLIGMNATLLNGCEIGEWSIVAAGAVVLENAKFPPYSLIAGVPAKLVRKLDAKGRKVICESCENHLKKLGER